MLLGIREITDKTIWEGFLAACKDKTFLHSWEWGEFQRAMRGKIWRLGIFSAKGETSPFQGGDGEELVALALTVKVVAKRGTFLLVPHGPVVKSTPSSDRVPSRITGQILQTLLERLKELAKEEGTSFIRINPIWERSEENEKIFKSLGGRNAPIQMHPEASWKLAITMPENELFSSFRDTTRYVIKKCQENKDITVRTSASMNDVELFSKLHTEVSLRQNFVPFSLEYLEKEFAAFSKDHEVLLFWGEYQKRVAAGAFVVFWSGIAFYHHAVSVSQYANLSIPYLLQWEAIKEAKRRGCKVYDFWGYVNPHKHPSHPWAGPTLFKMGFGGSSYEYVRTQDFPFSFRYLFTYLLETLRRIRRRL